MGDKRRSPLNKKLVPIALAASIPLIVALIWALVSLSYSSARYEKITKSVTCANGILEFKERMDYSMYLAVIGKSEFDELGDGSTTVNGIVTVDPYDYMDETDETLDDLLNMSTMEVNKNQAKRLKNTLVSLRAAVETLEDKIKNSDSYDDNMAYLEDNIYMLTTMFEDGVMEYIRGETVNLGDIRVDQAKRNKNIYMGCLIVVCIAMLIAMFTIYRALRAVTEPINRLCEMSKELSKGNFDVKADTENTNIDEIAILSENFNEMAGEIGELIEDITQKQKDLSLLETKLLQAQINPHFLYNTLDTIVWLAEENQNREVVSMVTSLSDFFRSTLSKGRDIIKVSEEENHIESYLKIQQFRYQDIMEYSISIEEDIKNVNIPKLLLQPLVENALYHGVKNKRGKSRIDVRGFKKGENIVFEVEDSGGGMDNETLKRLRKNIEKEISEDTTESFGLANVNSRIRHYYGDDCGLTIESVKDEGTIARIIIKENVL